MKTKPKRLDLIERNEKGEYDLHVHAGQYRALMSEKRFILVSAGWQAGKTLCGPPWLIKEIAARGPGDYLVASPSYPLMTKKVLPEVLKVFGRMLGLGTFVGGSKNVFTFSSVGMRKIFGKDAEGGVQVFFGHAADPDSLESATYKAAWMDEAGQKTVRLASWEAILGRLSIHQGRVLITSRPYDMGWMKQVLYDPWIASGKNHPLIDVINFRSVDNPAFPKEEYERARESMPGWRFRMKYDGLFEKPAGVIYDCFDDKIHKVKAFAVPASWPRYLGLDFGGVNTAAVFLAGELDAAGVETGRLFLFKEYLQGGRTAKEHAEEWLREDPRIPICCGGSHSEGQWRQEFAAAGLPVFEPRVREVEIGINRVWGTIKRNELLIFDTCTKTLDQIASYSRELDDMGEPTEAIQDKASFHMCFVAGTMVETNNGPVAIENIAVGDMVLTRKGYMPVAYCSENTNESVMDVVFSDGRRLCGTPNHPVFVVGKGKVPIVNLSRGDKIITCEPKQLLSMASSTHAIQTQNGTRCAITTGIIKQEASGCSFIGKFGNLSTEKSPKVTTSTTKTKTQVTTALEILHALVQASTARPHTRHGEAKPSLKTSPRCGRLALLLPNWRLPAIVGRLLREWALFLLSILFVLSVKAFAQLRRMASTEAPTAQRSAERFQGSTMLSGLASFVEKNSQSQNTSRPSIAPVRVSTVLDTGKTATVYNLSVDGQHEYFANGVLVSNCDAIRYIVSYLRGDHMKVHELLDAIIDSRKPSPIEAEILPENEKGGVVWFASYGEYHIYTIKDGVRQYTFSTTNKAEAIQRWEESQQ